MLQRVDFSDMPPSDPWRLADRHSIHISYLLSSTLEVLAIADWAWQTRLNALLVRTASLVLESRSLSDDVARGVVHLARLS